jgi:hypothetical protein
MATLLALAGGALALEMVHPTGGEYLSGTTTVEWADETPDEEYELILYDSGTELQPELCRPCTGFTYEFDTTEYADGSEYVLRVDDDLGASDDNKDKEEVTTSGSFTIDNTVPETTVVELDGHAGEAGWWTSDVLVELEARDETSGVAETLYAVDGGDETTYTDSVRLADDGVRELAVHSVDRAGNAEDVRTLTIPIDQTDPVSQVDIGEPNADRGRATYVNEDTEITLSASDATSGVDRIEYRLEDGAFQVYDGPITLDGEDGETLLEYRAVDTAGNVEDTNVVRLALDAAAPLLDRDRPQQGGAYANDTLIAETHPLNVEADQFRVTQESTRADTVDFAVAVGELTVQATSADAGSGVSEVRFFVDGELRETVTERPYEWTWDTGKETLGEHELTIESEDRVTNVATAGPLDVQVVPDDPDGLNATVNEGPSIPDRVPVPEEGPAVAGPSPDVQVVRPTILPSGLPVALAPVN